MLGLNIGVALSPDYIIVQMNSLRYVMFLVLGCRHVALMWTLVGCCLRSFGPVLTIRGLGRDLE